MTDKILSANDDEFRQPDLMLAVVTATIFGVSALLFPMMICGCHFHAIAVLPTLTPLFWSLDPAKGYFLRRQWMRRGDRIGSTISRIAPQRCATGSRESGIYSAAQNPSTLGAFRSEDWVRKHGLKLSRNPSSVKRGQVGFSPFPMSGLQRTVLDYRETGAAFGRERAISRLSALR